MTLKSKILLMFIILSGFFIFLNSAHAYTTIDSDVVWAKEQSPIILDDTVWVSDAGSLTIEHGVVIKLDLECSLAVTGDLDVQGTLEDPVVFTSIKDDEYGGDSNNDGDNSQPQPKDWQQLAFNTGSVGTINNAIIKYGGGEEEAIINVHRGKLTISGSTITDNSAGLKNSEGEITVSNSSIYHNILSWENMDAGISNNGSEVFIINAVNNWWGSADGPCPWRKFINEGASYNDIPELCGNKPLVDVGIMYNPWLTADPNSEDNQTLDPVVIIPGIMGSWFKNGEWQLDPITHTYDDLHKALINQGGYVPNETLFTFPYEWRQSNVITAFELRNKINEIQAQTGAEKVDIIAHSMGGLVVRHYVTGDFYGNDIDQIIFLGTPHRGSPKAYLQWEAAEGFADVEGVIAKLYFNHEAHVRGYDTLFDYIQNYVITVKQLLPDYAYLRNVGQQNIREYDPINLPDNYPYNDFLTDLNSESKINQFENSGVRVFNITGTNSNNTIGLIDVSSNNEHSPMWEHGYAENILYVAGDGAVPWDSSSLFTPSEIYSDHNSLPTDAQMLAIEYLTGAMPSIEIRETPKINNAVVVQIFSPADFLITDPDGQKLGKNFATEQEINEMTGSFYSGFDTETEFAVIPNPLEGEYKIELKGTSLGLYKLSVNYINDEQEIERDVSSIINTEQMHSFSFNYSEQSAELIKKLEPSEEVRDISINGLITALEEIQKQNLLKKGDGNVLIVRLQILKKSLDFIDAQVKIVKNLIEKTENSDRLKPKIKEKTLEVFNARIDKLVSNRQKIINDNLDKFIKRLNMIKDKNRINEENYDIIKINIDYLKQNL